MAGSIASSARCGAGKERGRLKKIDRGVDRVIAARESLLASHGTQILVEKKDKAAAGKLAKAFDTAKDPAHVLRALWTIYGLEAFDTARWVKRC